MKGTTGSLFLNIGHRGARAFAPENTIPAIRMAKRMAANAVKLDVQMSRDGELVVFHDDDLVRCSDAVHKYPLHTDYTLSAFTCEELLVLDVGSWYVNELTKAPLHRQLYLRDLAAEEVERWIAPSDADEYESGSVCIPRLGEALAVAHECQLIVVLDLKTIPRRHPSIAPNTIALIRELGMERETLVTSFDHVLLSDLRRHDDTIATGVLTAERLYRRRDYLHALDADAFEPDRGVIRRGVGPGDLDTETIHALTSAGLMVNVWTENSETRMRALIDAGVTGIFTDYPNRLAQALAGAGREASSAPS